MQLSTVEIKLNVVGAAFKHKVNLFPSQAPLSRLILGPMSQLVFTQMIH